MSTREIIGWDPGFTERLVKAAEAGGSSRREIFERVWRAAAQAAGRVHASVPHPRGGAHAPIPYMNEPWYC